jgi:hypothetical protein
MNTGWWILICFVCVLSGFVLGWWTRNYFRAWWDWERNDHVSREATGVSNWVATQAEIDRQIRRRMRAIRG